jgi:hypothetical protein
MLLQLFPLVASMMAVSAAFCLQLGVLRLTTADNRILTIDEHPDLTLGVRACCVRL